MNKTKGETMQIHNLIQGTAEWHEYRACHFNASDAPAMLGCSPYKTRSDLLKEMATGFTPEVDAMTQRRFDDGQRYEALARPMAEEIIGEELYPVVGSEGKYSASFDGLTMDGSVAYEHKTLNDDLRSVLQKDLPVSALPKQYRIQMEQQCMVSGAERVLFMASKWNGDALVEERHCWYYPDAALRAEIIAGWEQFDIDLANYQPVEVIPAAVAEPTMGLPALSIKVDGAISLITNLDLFGAKLTAFIEGIDKAPADDQAFANCEAAVKVLQKAQDALEAAEANALAQTASIDDLRKTVAMYSEMARSNRLMLEKLVKARKEQIRVEIQQEGKDKAAEHIGALNDRLGKPYMPAIAADFAGAMKGKKTVSSLRDAMETELAKFKIDANAVADRIQTNLNTLRELAKDYVFLFADTAQIVLKSNDDLTALVKLRIAEHQAAEEKRLAAERERIAAEEAKKAEAKIRAEQEASTQRQQAMMEAHQQRRTEEANTPTEAPAPANVVKLAEAGKTTKMRPTETEIIDVLAAHYGAKKVDVISWLLDAKFNLAMSA